jgi:hypothetical protein
MLAVIKMVWRVMGGSAIPWFDLDQSARKGGDTVWTEFLRKPPCSLVKLARNLDPGPLGIGRNRGSLSLSGPTFAADDVRRYAKAFTL